MPYDSTTAMTDILDGLAIADPNAAEAFIHRQSIDSVRELPGAAELLRDRLLMVQLQRPDELVAWKDPAQAVAVPKESLQRVLNAAVTGDQEAITTLLDALAFGQLATLQSLACFMGDSARRMLALHGAVT